MRVVITSPSRIHLSLIDLNGSLGRIDGGIGFGLLNPTIIVEVTDEFEGQNSVVIEAKEEYKPIIQEIIQNFQTKYGIKFERLKIQINSMYRPHIGLGSKTQLLLSVAKGLCVLKDIDCNGYELCSLVKRGGTSGIGYSVFEKGGFILDAGHSFGPNKEKQSFLPSSASNAPPALHLIRYNFPETWKIILITLNVQSGAYDKEEVNIFQKYCPIPQEEVQEISHLILMKVLPSLILKNLPDFCDAIMRIQKIGFKKIEVSLVHPKVRDLIQYSIEIGAKCAALSSFGPTIAIIEDNTAKITEIIGKIQQKFEEFEPEIIVTTANNEGAKIEKK
jgi:beta-ribofuranosylaminobenzene 5'-phosphate synthase